ncbi:MAG: hypothetical protein WBK20_03010 [Spirochaetota bacterium]
MNNYKTYTKKINFDKEYIMLFYFIPFLSNASIMDIIKGGNTWGPYKNALTDVQVRILGVFTSILCIYIIYNVLIQWPKTIGGKQKVKEVLKIFLSSWFLFLWVQSFMLYFCYEIYHIAILKYAYFITIGVCVYFQHKFIKRVNELLNSDNTKKVE